MAEVETEARQSIDRLLDGLLLAWRDLPSIAQEIDKWDLIDQLDYIEEWTPKEDQLARLRRLIVSEGVTQQQRCRYEQLERLVRANRPNLIQRRSS